MNRFHRIRGRLFTASIVFYSALLIVTLATGAFLGIDALGTLRISAGALFAGLAATLPALGMIVWLDKSRMRGVSELRRFARTQLAPLLSGLSTAQIALLAVLVGLVEEAFFRGLVQGGLEAALAGAGIGAVAPWGALAVASVIFGLCHAINRTYFLFATLMGGYLGAAWILVSPRNLLIPVVVHALYDFAAIYYLLRADRSDKAHGRHDQG